MVTKRGGVKAAEARGSAAMPMREGREAGLLRPQPANLPTTTEALCPPKPSVFDMA